MISEPDDVLLLTYQNLLLRTIEMPGAKVIILTETK